MPRRFLSVVEVSITISLLFLLFACGTGLQRNSGGSTPIAITMPASSTTVSSGASQQFQATVTGSSNTSVQWQVNNVAGGNAQVGTISSGGLYTAPATTVSMTVTVTAVAAADPTKTANVTVTITPGSSGAITVSISPISVTISINSSQQFNAGVGGTSNTTVSWSVDGVSGGNSTIGTVDVNGAYTAPGTAGSHTVTATSSADNTKTASATVTVVSLTVFPTSTTVTQSATAQFTATVQGSSNTGVTWSVDGVNGGNATVGKITAGGLYAAPAADGSHAITATSSALPTYSVNAAVTVGSGGSNGITAVKHIIFLSQENRSFDAYFGKLNEYRARQGLPASVDGLPDDCQSSNSDWTVPCGAMNKSPDANGYPTTPVYAFRLKSMCIENTSADWIASHWDFNAGSPGSDTPMLDGFAISAASAALSTGTSDTKGIRAMGFYNGDDLAYPYWLATEFATSDRWFSPAPTKTEPNRYFMVGATSGGQAYPTGTAIQAKTIFDLLQQAGVSWKIYKDTGGVSASAFAGFTSRYGSSGNIVPLSQFVTDAQSGNLPEVAYIEKPDADEHPGITTNIQDGVAQVRTLVNAVMYDQNGGPGPSWKDSVMIITFDEGGGLYDHVAPPTNVPSPDGIKPVDTCTSASDPNCATASITHGVPPYDPVGDFTRYGFRVPLMVISPFTKPNYVSHTVTDYTSWMKFVETRFGLPNLNARDAAASDMTEFFDFQNAPLATPPANPPTVNYGSCYDSLP